MIYYFNPPFIAFVLKKKVTVTLCRAYPLFSTCERTYQFFFYIRILLQVPLRFQGKLLYLNGVLTILLEMQTAAVSITERMVLEIRNLITRFKEFLSFNMDRNPPDTAHRSNLIINSIEELNRFFNTVSSKTCFMLYLSDLS